MRLITQTPWFCGPGEARVSIVPPVKTERDLTEKELRVGSLHKFPDSPSKDGSPVT